MGVTKNGRDINPQNKKYKIKKRLGPKTGCSDRESGHGRREGWGEELDELE